MRKSSVFVLLALVALSAPGTHTVPPHRPHVHAVTELLRGAGAPTVL